MHAARCGRPVRILGIDGTGQKIKRRGRRGHVGVGFAVDAERQVLLGVELMEEENSAEVRRFVEGLCRRYDMDVILTDEHSSYAEVMRSRRTRAEHRLCQAHWKKSKQLRARSLRVQAQEQGDWPMARDLARIQRLIRNDPPDARDPLARIYSRYQDVPVPPPGQTWSRAYHMRMLVLHLLETWNRIGADTQPTNNTAERLIGLLLKERSKTMRGFARPDSIPRFVHLAAYLREPPKGVPLRFIP
jgi:transposase-like protein